MPETTPTRMLINIEKPANRISNVDGKISDFKKILENIRYH